MIQTKHPSVLKKGFHPLAPDLELSKVKKYAKSHFVIMCELN